MHTKKYCVVTVTPCHFERSSLQVVGRLQCTLSATAVSKECACTLSETRAGTSIRYNVCPIPFDVVVFDVARTKLQWRRLLVSQPSHLWYRWLVRRSNYNNSHIFGNGMCCPDNNLSVKFASQHFGNVDVSVSTVT
jgi:hypothetical protein